MKIYKCVRYVAAGNEDVALFNGVFIGSARTDNYEIDLKNGVFAIRELRAMQALCPACGRDTPSDGHEPYVDDSGSHKAGAWQCAQTGEVVTLAKRHTKPATMVPLANIKYWIPETDG